MNILIMTAMFPPIQTGTSFYSKNLAETLVQHGHRVRVVTVRNRQPDNERHNFQVFRIKALHLPLKNYFKHLRICSIFLCNYKFLVKIVQKNRPDVILLVNHYLDIAFPAIYLAKRFKIPIVISVGTELQSLNPLRNKILLFFDRLICGYLIFSNCQKIIAWDKEIKRYLIDVHGAKISKKIVMVGYGANGKIEDFIGYKHNYQLTNQILGVGAVIEQRNFQFMIRVFKELLKFYPQLRLKIIGHLYWRPTLELVKKLGIENRVTFTGELPHAQVVKELQKSVFHWGVLSGKYVGLGTANLEAMLMGLPIVSNVPANLFGQPLLGDMENYLFTDGKSQTKIIIKLKLLIAGRSLREKIGQNGRRFVQKNLNWGKVAKDMTKVFEEVVNLR